MSADTYPEPPLLDYYHCTFFLPLIGLDQQAFVPDERTAFRYKPGDFKEEKVDENRLTEEEKEARAKRRAEFEAQAQAYCFFSPALRNILFDIEGKESHESRQIPLKEWRLAEKDIASWAIHLGKEEQRGDPFLYQIASVVSVHLYRYFNGIYLLSFRVEPRALQELRKNKECPLFKPDAPKGLRELQATDRNRAQLYEQMQLECWLRFTRLARLIYPSFAEQYDEKKIALMRLFEKDAPKKGAFGTVQSLRIPKSPGEDISPLIRFLLKSFAANPEKLDPFLDGYENLYDDRMFVSVAYGLAGDKLPDDQLNRIYGLASFVDRFEDTWKDLNYYAYTPDEIDARLKAQTFGLWKGLGGQYAFTDTANVYVSRDGFFRTIIAPIHVPILYDRMLVLALFYQASLRLYDQRISANTTNILEHGNLELIRDQRKQFIHFTNQYWFHNITEQMQGREIFQLQQRALALSEHYEIIKDELERTDEYLQREDAIRQQKFSDRVTRYGLALALVAIYVSALPLWIQSFQIPKDTGFWQIVRPWTDLFYGFHYFALISMFFVAPLLLFWQIGKSIGKRHKTE